ncbi:MAG: hypothetical protein M3Z82_00095 [Apilactobacillus sp.]|nr:hypothetical protein [Apilactobacillus sp.]
MNRQKTKKKKIVIHWITVTSSQKIIAINNNANVHVQLITVYNGSGWYKNVRFWVIIK